MHEKAAATHLIDQLEALLHRGGHDGVVITVVDDVHDDSFLGGFVLRHGHTLVKEEDASGLPYFKTANNVIRR